MRSYIGYVIATVAVVLFIGATGFHFAEHGTNPNVRDFGDSLWWALVTITTVGYGDITPVTEMGRLFGAIVMITGIGALGVFTAAVAAYLIRFDQLDVLRIRSVRDHVVIAGLGGPGLLLAQAFARSGERVVVLEKDERNPRIPAARDAHVAVLIGDATRAESLRRARLGWARHLVVVAGADATNVDVSAQAREVPRLLPGPLSCSSQIEDPELWYALRSWEIGARDAFRLEFFNPADLGARALLAKHSPFGGATTPRVLVLGAGALSQYFVRHMARSWRDVRGDRGPMHIMLLDTDTEAMHRRLHERHPELKGLASVTAYSMDVRSPEFQRAEFLFDPSGRCVVTHAYVCIEDDGLALSAALHLVTRLRRFRVPVVVRVTRQAGLASLLSVVGRPGDRASDELQVFSVLEEAYAPELVLRGTNEILARALHQDYLQRTGSQPGNPAAVAWDALPRELQDANRTQADDIAEKLEAIGCHIVPLTALEQDDFRLTEAEVERLARMEHERWLAERTALGWTFGPRDPEKKTNPNLVPWQDLDEHVRAMNLDSVRQLPLFLNRAGFTAHRYSA